MRGGWIRRFFWFGRSRRCGWMLGRGGICRGLLLGWWFGWMDLDSRVIVVVGKWREWGIDDDHD